MVGERARVLEGWGILRSDQQLTAGSTVRVYASGEHGDEAFREDCAHDMVRRPEADEWAAAWREQLSGPARD
ncbi:hypothetical protein ACQ4PT_042102 [Festuca glaucescens]